MCNLIMMIYEFRVPMQRAMKSKYILSIELTYSDIILFRVQEDGQSIDEDTKVQLSLEQNTTVRT